MVSAYLRSDNGNLPTYMWPGCELGFFVSFLEAFEVLDTIGVLTGLGAPWVQVHVLLLYIHLQDEVVMW